MLHARRAGVLRRPACRSRSCTSTPGTTSPRSSSSATARVAELGVELIVASRAGLDRRRSGRARRSGRRRSRATALQTVTLLDAIAEHRFDAVFGGARRDEERARAKERVCRHRDEFGQWDPKNQRPELWGLYNSRHRPGEHVRIFPLSNWTELDIWRFVAEREVELPGLYFAHRRQVFRRDGMLMAVDRHVALIDGEAAVREPVRFRTIGDATCTAAVESVARTVADVIAETAVARSPSAAPPAPTTDQRGGHGRPQAAGLLLMTRDALLRRCGSPRSAAVDDGKSTLIGRLLHDSKSIFEDQLEHIEAVSRRRGDRLRRPRPAHRRPARRARAGHHDRRRLPVLLDAAPRLRDRRLPGPHPVHAQHGHRRLDRRSGDRAGRRPPRRRRADAAPQPARLRCSACRTS